MRRATVTIDDELESSLDAYLRQQEVTPALTAVVHSAIKEFLTRRGFAPGQLRLRITPARKGSGVRDTSLAHDRYLAGK